MSVMTNMIDVLKNADIDAYLPGKHAGPCKSAYVVIEDDGVRQTGKTTGRHLYVVTAFVPVNAPTELVSLLSEVRLALSGVGAVRPTGERSPDEIVEEIGAYCASEVYSALCSL